MNDAARRTLCDLVRQHGHGLVVDPRRCEGLLKDYCGEYRREIFVLVSAIKERVPADLITASEGMPAQALIARLKQRLCDNLAFSEDAAEWAVETWAIALGVSLEGSDIPGNEPAPSKKMGRTYALAGSHEFASSEQEAEERSRKTHRPVEFRDHAGRLMTVWVTDQELDEEGRPLGGGVE